MESPKKKRKINTVVRILIVFLLIAVYGISVYLTLVPYVETEFQSWKARHEAEGFAKGATDIENSYKDTLEYPITGYKRMLKKTGVIISEKDLVLDYGASGELEHADLLADMIDYNERIYLEDQNTLSDAWTYKTNDFDVKKYGLDDGIVGVLDIPSMGVSFPLRLGGSDYNMATGVAQLSGTSMPIGGINTNCVIVGHRGWINGGKFLKDIEMVEVGDVVTLTNLWYPMEYKVVEIKIIYPNDIDEIRIDPGKDLLSIVTCHPYGTGGRYYRYVLVCERVPFKQMEVSEKYEWVDEPYTNVEKEKLDLVNMPKVVYFSSEKEIVIDDVIHRIGCVLAVGVPILAIVLAVLSRRRSKRRG